jgi:predicted acetyltransferase
MAMALQLRWANRDELDLVARTRLRCYGTGDKELPSFINSLTEDDRCVPSQYLLAEENGQSVATATSYAYRMWVRGAALPCQGVAWVGAIKTHRRRGASSTGRDRGGGAASAVMRHLLQHARQRGDVLSALMPFRASYYEHFGYGLVERRREWRIPLTLLPAGPAEGLRYFEPADLPALADCRQRIAQAGQCDIERPLPWDAYMRSWPDGFVIVDRPAGEAAAHGWFRFTDQRENGKDNIVVDELFYDSMDALQRILYFLASLRDQYLEAILHLPADLPLNRLLREPQIPHRIVEHPTAAARCYTRMQVRILDHVRFLQALKLPADSRGTVTIAIHETEGPTSRLRLEFDGGRCVAGPTEQTAQLECSDKTWAAIATGDLCPLTACALGLLKAADPAAASVLRCLHAGPAPYCREFF